MSAVKFVLVVGFFMHLRYDHNIMRSLFIGPLIIAICIIVALMALFSAFVLLPRPSRSAALPMVGTDSSAEPVGWPHGCHGYRAGPPPLPPEGFDWTVWNADPCVWWASP